MLDECLTLRSLSTQVEDTERASQESIKTFCSTYPNGWVLGFEPDTTDYDELKRDEMRYEAEQDAKQELINEID